VLSAEENIISRFVIFFIIFRNKSWTNEKRNRKCVGSLRTAAVAVVLFIQQHIISCCQICTMHAARKQLLLSGVYSRKTASVVGCVQQENNYCCRMCTAGKQLLLLDVYSRKTAAVVRCVQQENSCCCQMCTAGKQLRLSGVYSRKTTAVVGCVQQENSCCCRMCTAGKQLLLSDVYSCTSVPKSCLFFRQPVHLYRCVRPFVHPSVYVFLPICLSIPPSVSVLSHWSNEGYWQSLYTFRSICRVLHLLACSVHLPFSVPFRHKIT